MPGQIATIPFSITNSFTLAVIPLFILMGSLATQAALTTDLYRAAYLWLGRLPGGLAMATTLASAAFGAACGSTVVNAAVFTGAGAITAINIDGTTNQLLINGVAITANVLANDSDSALRTAINAVSN